ncbi:MAG TPA: hypothetical protein VGT98_05600, partial [Candidatus Elarobacter sp.]|nr:hypothetical protein [Candidatus Elarobacter sp.]
RALDRASRFRLASHPFGRTASGLANTETSTDHREASAERGAEHGESAGRRLRRGRVDSGLQKSKHGHGSNSWFNDIPDSLRSGRAIRRRAS